MLKILINLLEIDFDGSISYRMLNPMFNSEMSHSFNIKTINTARNKDIISQLHLPETGYNQVRFEAMIITDAFTFKGAIYFNSVTDKYLDFQFNSNNDFWNLADVSLRTITMPFDVNYLPVKNSKFMDNFPLLGDGYSGYINGLNENGLPAEDETTAPVPFLRFNSVISGIFAGLGIDIIQNELAQHADIEQLYLYNSNSNGYYWFPILSFDSIYFQVSISDEKYVFYCAYGHGIINNSYVLINSAYLRPIAAQEQLLNKVMQATVEDEYNISFDIVPIVTTLQGSPNQITVIKPIYLAKISEDARNHLPEINCGEFLKEVEKLTASRVFIDESSQSARIIFLKNILKSNDIIDISDVSGNVSEQTLDKIDGYKLSYENPSEDDYYADRVKELTDQLTVKDPVATYNNLPLIGNANNDVRLVTDENCYYRYFTINFLRSAGWEFYSENVLKLQEGAGKLSIQTKFSPVLFVKIGTFPFLFPYACVEKEGQFIIINGSNYEDFRLFFYRGDFEHVNQSVLNERITTPLLTNDVYDHNGDKIATANLSLRWDGDYGLYEQLYKEYIDLMINRYREETRFINWPLWMLNSFPWWHKYRINHMNYLVKSIDLLLKSSGAILKNSILVPV